MPTKEQVVTAAAFEAIQEATYRVDLPSIVDQGKWDGLLAPASEVREGFRVLGRGSARYAFLLAFLEVSGFGNCPPGLFGTLENMLLSESILRAIMAKPEHPDVDRICTLNEVISDTFYMFIGGLCEEAADLTLVTPFIKDLFIPLIRAGMTAYHAHPGSVRRSAVNRAKVCGAPNFIREVEKLHRIRDLQFATHGDFQLATHPPATQPSTPSPLQMPATSLVSQPTIQRSDLPTPSTVVRWRNSRPVRNIMSATTRIGMRESEGDASVQEEQQAASSVESISVWRIVSSPFPLKFAVNGNEHS
ncbi:hypothetical protein B0H15DRAFT_1024224, partial [Mycena belliarum]